MTKTIRIVGHYLDVIDVQFREKDDWNQVSMTLDEFEEMMRKDFPTYWKEFEESDCTDRGDFFFRYGYENGETYEFVSDNEEDI